MTVFDGICAKLLFDCGREWNSLRLGERDQALRLRGQAKNQVEDARACSGTSVRNYVRTCDQALIETRLGASIAMEVQAQPDEAADATETDLFWSQPGGVTGGDPSHLGEVVDRSELDVAGARELAHGLKLAGDDFASGNAGLGAAIENFFYGIKSAVIDALSEGDIERLGRGRIVDGQHAEGFEYRERYAALELDGGGIER
jgi:hypothetical protein